MCIFYNFYVQSLHCLLRVDTLRIQECLENKPASMLPLSSASYSNLSGEEHTSSVANSSARKVATGYPKSCQRSVSLRNQ